jgi:hypothetical protein
MNRRIRVSAGAMAEYVSRGGAGRVIQVISVILAAIIVLYIIFVLIGANSGNTIVSTDSDWASTLSSWFKDLFTPANWKLRVVLNYGLAALFYLVVGRILAVAVDRL